MYMGLNPSAVDNLRPASLHNGLIRCQLVNRGWKWLKLFKIRVTYRTYCGNCSIVHFSTNRNNWYIIYEDRAGIYVFPWQKFIIMYFYQHWSRIRCRRTQNIITLMIVLVDTTWISANCTNSCGEISVPDISDIMLVFLSPLISVNEGYLVTIIVYKIINEEFCTKFQRKNPYVSSPTFNRPTRAIKLSIPFLKVRDYHAYSSLSILTLLFWSATKVVI